MQAPLFDQQKVGYKFKKGYLELDYTNENNN